MTRVGQKAAGCSGFRLSCFPRGRNSEVPSRLRSRRPKVLLSARRAQPSRGPWDRLAGHMVAPRDGRTPCKGASFPPCFCRRPGATEACLKNSVIILAHRSPQCCKDTDHVIYSCIRVLTFSIYHGTELSELLFAPSMVLVTRPEVGCREG